MPRPDLTPEPTPGDLSVATLTIPGHSSCFAVVEHRDGRFDVLTAPFDDPDEADACSAWIAQEYSRLDAEWTATGLNPIDVVVAFRQTAHASRPWARGPGAH